MLDEAPDNLIYSAIEGFETQPDISSLERIALAHERVLSSRREKVAALEREVSELENQLQEVMAELKVLSSPTEDTYKVLQCEPTESSGSAKDVFELISSKSIELDNEKVALAKQLTEIESSINQMSMTRLKLARRKEEIEHQTKQALASNVANNFNTTSMKISLFKKLGVHIEDHGSGNDKIMVFDSGGNSASVLEVDSKYSDYFISNYIWEKLGNVE